MADDVHRLRKRAMQRRKAKLAQRQERLRIQEQYQDLDPDEEIMVRQYDLENYRRDRELFEDQPDDMWIVPERVTVWQ